MLQAVVQSYFSLNDTQDSIAGKQANITKNPYMSFGTFSTNMQGVYSWGVLRQAKLSGMMMDIDRLSATSVDNDNNYKNWTTFNAGQGPRMSANEHLVPERFFNDFNSTTKSVYGISAVKALQIAANQGQKIYTINKNNVNTVLPLISHDSGTIQEVQNAVATGKVVTISQTKVTVSGWSGSGYIILDPATGAGAYMIAGGADGGILVFFMIVLLAITLVTILTAMTGGLIAIALGILGIVGWLDAVSKFLNVLKNAKNFEELNKGMLNIGLPLIFGALVSKVLKIKVGDDEHQEDFAILIINDIVLTWMWGIFDSDDN